MKEDDSIQILVALSKDEEPYPSTALIQKWAHHALLQENKQVGLSIAIVDANEIQALNRDYRNKDKPTNVLSFKADIPPDVNIEINLLGDIILCAKVINQEASIANIPMEAHWAHMLIHGTLHLQGYDHMKVDEAIEMEAVEVKLLKELGYPNPYTQNGDE